MLLNPDPYKQSMEICFSQKRNNRNYPSMMFNDTKVELATSQKHLGLILYSRIGFNEHIDNKINKCNRLIGIMKILPLTLSGKSLLKTYKSFVRSNRD